jgi:hypothetical protein
MYCARAPVAKRVNEGEKALNEAKGRYWTMQQLEYDHLHQVRAYACNQQ